jgi:hypothetical protein
MLTVSALLISRPLTSALLACVALLWAVSRERELRRMRARMIGLPRARYGVPGSGFWYALLPSLALWMLGYSTVLAVYDLVAR